ncbi:MAG: hypothetical protein ACI85O_001960 [Saprospiraceae bacterium]|jgi:hypothetical protein
MDTIENNMGSLIDDSQVPFVQTALRYGLIGGAASVITGLIMHITGISDGSSLGMLASTIISGVIGLGIFIGFQIAAVRKHRDEELGGYISFGRAFLVCLIVAFTISVISIIWNYVYMNFIDPDFMSRVIDNTIEFMEKMELSDDIIEQAIEDVKAGVDNSVMGQLKSLGGSTIFSSIIGLIVAASTKKEAPLV